MSQCAHRASLRRLMWAPYAANNLFSQVSCFAPCLDEVERHGELDTPGCGLPSAIGSLDGEATDCETEDHPALRPFMPAASSVRSSGGTGRANCPPSSVTRGSSLGMTITQTDRPRWGCYRSRSLSQGRGLTFCGRCIAISARSALCQTEWLDIQSAYARIFDRAASV